MGLIQICEGAASFAGNGEASEQAAQTVLLLGC